jgi:hypothetical protein
MRKTAIGIAIVMLILSAAAVAASQFGIGDKREVTFYNAVRIGETLVPAGEYVVVHEMKGTDHIMVFSKAGKKTVEVRVKCTLTPLSTPAARTELQFKPGKEQEPVLTRMVFKGDRAEHLF